MEHIPSGPAYQYGQAILQRKLHMTKQAVMRRMKHWGMLFEGITFESFSTTVEMALGGGHQAVTENGYGITKYDDENGENIVTNVKFYPATCVMPPEGVNSVDWIKVA